MKPEAGQWWQMKDDAETRCFIVGECRNGNYIIEWKDGEYSEDNMEDWEHIPDCDDFNWKEPETVNDELKEQVAAFIGNYYGDQCDEYEQDCIICSKWKAFRELFELPEPPKPKPKPEPQPAEDPDEWVIQDRVPVRVGDRCWWVNAVYQLPASADEMQIVDIADEEFEKGLKHGSKHPRVLNTTLHVMCRRRDLPKVEQVEQALSNSELKAVCDDVMRWQAERWPKYYVPVNAAYSLIEQKPVAYFRRDDEESGRTFHTDGTSYRFDEWTDNLVEVKQLTEAEAMALLNKPKQCAVGCHGPRCPNPALPDKDHCSECEPTSDGGINWSYHEKQKPQPKKTMLRLWIDSDCNIHAGLKGDSDLELHYDHETRQFYTEEQS